MYWEPGTREVQIHYCERVAFADEDAYKQKLGEESETTELFSEHQRGFVIILENFRLMCDGYLGKIVVVNHCIELELAVLLSITSNFYSAEFDD